MAKSLITSGITFQSGMSYAGTALFAALRRRLTRSSSPAYNLQVA
jgi:hypothetical protein